MPRPLRIFYSYSHKDAKMRERLEEHLGLLRSAGLIEPWHDRKIEAGEDWDRRISEHLEQADIILLLVSASFTNSAYCYEIEVKRALKKHAEGTAWVIPVFLSKCDLTYAEFRDLQRLPSDRPIDSWRNRNEAFAEVAKGIRVVVERLRAGQAALEKPAIQTSRRIPPLLPYLCNRSDQETSLREAMGTARAAHLRRPFLLISHGHWREAHDFFLSRMERTLPRLAGMAEKPLHRLTPLAWPSGYRESATPRSLFGPLLSTCLDCDPYAEVPALAADLSRDEGLVLLTSTLYTRDWTPAGENLLQAWLRFWAEWPDLPAARVLVPVLSIKYQDQPADSEIRRVLSDLKLPQEVSGTVLPELVPVGRAEVENWIYKREVREFWGSDEPAEWIRHVDRMYESDAALPMELLADKLKQLLTYALSSRPSQS